MTTNVLNAICVLKAIIARVEEGTELGARAALAAANAGVLLGVLANIRIAPPDADGLVWVGVDMGSRIGRVAVPERSVAGQAFLDWGAQAELAQVMARGELGVSHELAGDRSDRVGDPSDERVRPA